jgi:signal transduction histidine kinase
MSLSRRDLKPLLQGAVALVQGNVKNIGGSISLSCESGLWVKVDPDQLQRVFLNCLNNSIFFLEHDSKPDAKRIEVSAVQRNSEVVIVFFDTGPGIAEEDLDKVFDYTFTRKGARGMGFGLAIAKRIIELHAGNISVSSRWGYFARFEIVLPTIINK